MKVFQEEVTRFCKSYGKTPPAFIRRVIASLLKNPELTEQPDYKRVYEEALAYLEQYDSAHLDFTKSSRQTEELLLSLINEQSPDYAYDISVLENYLHFRKQCWK